MAKPRMIQALIFYVNDWAKYIHNCNRHMENERNLLNKMFKKSARIIGWQYDIKAVVKLLH